MHVCVESMNHPLGMMSGSFMLLTLLTVVCAGDSGDSLAKDFEIVCDMVLQQAKSLRLAWLNRRVARQDGYAKCKAN